MVSDYHPDEKPKPGCSKGQADEHNPEGTERIAIAQAYRDIHHQCSSILAESWSGESGRLLARAHWFVHDLESWIKALSARKERQILASATREYHLALLSAGQGLYRQAFQGLRLVLELGLQTVQLSCNAVELEEWLQNRLETSWAGLMDEETGVFSARTCDAFFPELMDDLRHYRSLAKQLYSECSDYVHGGQRKYVTLPDSLIFSSVAIELWQEKADSLALSLAFALSMRYLRQFGTTELGLVEGSLNDRLGHVEAIRCFLGGPQGG